MTDSPATKTFAFDDGAPAGAPFLDGHFPSNPIVPGAILLGYAADALSEWDREIASVIRMKFLRPLLPEIPFVIEATETSDATTLVWRSDDGVIAKARVTCRDHHG